MMKKILLLIVSIMLLCGCNTKKEDNIQIEDGEDEFFTILSREVGVNRTSVSRALSGFFSP